MTAAGEIIDYTITVQNTGDGNHKGGSFRSVA
ncbi:MAG: hypothetical protein IPF54_04355 [Draconibacterium sp.]|nr:hypothetical protein [Draconibacterium sp.]